MSNHSRLLLPVVAISGSSLMVACGGGYSGGSCGSYGSCAPAPVPSAGGVYEGTVQGTPVVAIIAENGDGRISAQDGTYYHLNVATQGSGVSGSYFAYSGSGPFPNGTLSTTGTLSAVLTPSVLTGTLTDQTGLTASLGLNFDNVYNIGSALPTLAGTWSFTANGFSLTATILPDGTFTATDSAGCAYHGAFVVIDPNFDAYGESHVLSCNGVNVNFTGLASYFPPSPSVGASIQLFADDGAGDYLAVDLQ